MLGRGEPRYLWAKAAQCMLDSEGRPSSAVEQRNCNAKVGCSNHLGGLHTSLFSVQMQVLRLSRQR